MLRSPDSPPSGTPPKEGNLEGDLIIAKYGRYMANRGNRDIPPFGRNDGGVVWN
jgi:hypothetical protein